MRLQNTQKKNRFWVGINGEKMKRNVEPGACGGFSGVEDTLILGRLS